MINREHRVPHSCSVAVLTAVGRENVRGSLAGRIGAVVAIDTIAGDIRVIKNGR